MQHLSPSQIAELRKLLEAKLAKLESYTDTLAEESPEAYADRTTDNADSGDEALEDYEMMENQVLDDEAQNIKVDIVEALRRIDEGTYGLDVETKQPIPYERLKLYPWAKHNVQAPSK